MRHKEQVAHLFLLYDIQYAEWLCIYLAHNMLCLHMIVNPCFVFFSLCVCVCVHTLTTEALHGSVEMGLFMCRKQNEL